MRRNGGDGTWIADVFGMSRINRILVINLKFDGAEVYPPGTAAPQATITDHRIFVADLRALADQIEREFSRASSPPVDLKDLPSGT